MKNFLRQFFLKSLFSKLPIRLWERFLHFSIFNNKYNGLKLIKSLETREKLWDDIIGTYEDDSIDFLEFGVWKGYSIKYFAKKNKNKDSIFVGFDSFEGLPTNWTRNTPKGTFSVEGELPENEDKRITFIKGWFQNTLNDFIKNYQANKNLIVHYDADIFSATLYLLNQLDSLKIPYIAIFDQFLGHETRALYAYQELSGAEVHFISKKMENGYPVQVACQIIPAELYSPK